MIHVRTPNTSTRCTVPALHTVTHTLLNMLVVSLYKSVLLQAKQSEFCGPLHKEHPVGQTRHEHIYVIVNAHAIAFNLTANT